MELDLAWGPGLPNPDPDPDLQIEGSHAQAEAHHEELDLGEEAFVLEALPILQQQVGEIMDEEWSTFVEAIEKVYDEIITFDGPEGISESILRRTRSISVPALMKDSQKRIPSKFVWGVKSLSVFLT